MKRQRGLTMIELSVVMAVAAVLAGIAVPSWMSHIEQVRRTDGAAALTRLQMAQERHHSAFGRYATRLQDLPGISVRSSAGFYDLTLFEAQPDRFRATAAARSDGPQGRDLACHTLTLSVEHGMAQQDPSARCWGR